MSGRTHIFLIPCAGCGATAMYKAVFEDFDQGKRLAVADGWRICRAHVPDSRFPWRERHYCPLCTPPVDEQANETTGEYR